MDGQLQVEEAIMNCIHCQGEMKRDSSPFHIDRKGYHILLNDIPAWVCTQCGEPYFEEKEVEAIQELIKSVDQKAKSLALSA